MGHATFTYQYYENEGSKRGISLPANVVHSIDAYVLRCVHRRCNYNYREVIQAQGAVINEMQLRADGYTEQVPRLAGSGELDKYITLYECTAMADVVILPFIIDGHQTQYLSDQHLKALATIMEGMLVYSPFEIVTIHDAFKCHANNMNHLRKQYTNVLAELAESNIMQNILNQIHNCKGSYPKLTTNLGDLIRGSNYALS